MEKFFIMADTAKEQAIKNINDELLLLTICRLSKDREFKKEIDPLVCLTTQDEGGTERDFYFTFDQLSDFIDQLSAMRIDLMKETARVFEKQMKFKHYDSRGKRKG